jgi:glutamine---fructose-6-phosphate transaminase (isomerizing)
LEFAPRSAYLECMETKLARSIGTQARVLRELAASSFAAQASVLADAQRLVLIGTGSSFNAARLGAWQLRRHGIDATAMSSADLARWEPMLRRGDALVVVSHTGQTAYSMRARLDALAAGTPVVSITGAGADWPEAIIAGPAETSDTYTVSYLASLAAIARLADGIEALRAGASVRPASLTLLDTADRVEAAIATPDVAHINVPVRATAIVGAGPWAITAAEGALKLREAARVLAEAHDPESLLHGSAVPLTSADTLIALQPGADRDGLIDGLASAAHAEGVHVVTIEDERPLADPFYAQFPLTVRLQQLAAHFAQRRGQNPDDVIVGCWHVDSLWNAGRPVPAVR